MRPFTARPAKLREHPGSSKRSGSDSEAMITFHNESLVQPELCRLLTLSVPVELHAPLVFHSRQIPGAGPGVLGQVRWPDPEIHISLGMIWFYSSSSTDLWHELLRVCYHEFGHVATFWAHDYVSWNEYHAR